MVKVLNVGMATGKVETDALQIARLKKDGLVMLPKVQCLNLQNDHHYLAEEN